MLSNCKAVLFDMDGTLIASKSVIESAWITVASKYGVTVSHNDLEHHIHGRSGNYTLSYLFGDFPKNQQLIIKQEVDAIEENSPVELIPGARLMLEKLKKNGIKIGLVTSSWPERINFVLTYHDINDTFDCIVSRDDVVNGKPDPECFKLCAKKLNVPIDNCIIFEDSLTGLIAGINSGAKCIGINVSQIPENLNLFAVFENYLDIVNYKGLNGIVE